MIEFDPNNKVVKALVDHDLGITRKVGDLIRAKRINYWLVEAIVTDK